MVSQQLSGPSITVSFWTSLGGRMRNHVAMFLLFPLKLVPADVSRGERSAPRTLFCKVPQSSRFSFCLISSWVRYSISAGLSIVSIPMILNYAHTQPHTYTQPHINTNPPHQADFTSSFFPIVWRLWGRGNCEDGENSFGLTQARLNNDGF